MPELRSMGQLNTELFEHEFGTLRTDETIITSERADLKTQILML